MVDWYPHWKLAGMCVELEGMMIKDVTSKMPDFHFYECIYLFCGIIFKSSCCGFFLCCQWFLLPEQMKAACKMCRFFEVGYMEWGLQISLNVGHQHRRRWSFFVRITCNTFCSVFKTCCEVLLLKEKWKNKIFPLLILLSAFKSQNSIFMCLLDHITDIYLRLNNVTLRQFHLLQPRFVASAPLEGKAGGGEGHPMLKSNCMSLVKTQWKCVCLF